MKGNIKNSKSRVNALFYIKKIFFEISGLSYILAERENDLLTLEQVLSKHTQSGTVKSGLKFFLLNKKVVYSNKLESKKKKISAEELLHLKTGIAYSFNSTNDCQVFCKIRTRYSARLG